ncbi:MAG TPA: SBBP repeat-containing protein [Bryobacteraceae bacterium]
MKLWVLVLFSTLALRAADYATYIGDDLASRPKAITTDSAGNTYVLADRRNFPGYFVGTRLVKLNRAGALVSDLDLTDLVPRANSVAVDGAGNVFLVDSGGSVTKMDGRGAVLLSVPLGGTQGGTTLKAVAVDAAGFIYVAGETGAPDYPHVGGSLAGVVQGGPYPTYGGFFAKLSPAGKIIYAGAIAATQYCSLCVPSTGTSGNAIAVDSAGNAYIAGNTTGLALTGTEGTANAKGTGNFLMKLDPVGAVAFLNFEFGSYVGVDSGNNVYTAGGGGVAKLNPAGGVIWTDPLAVFGGTPSSTSLAVDAAGNVWIVGQANPGPSGSSSVEYLAEINSAGAVLSTEPRATNTTDAGLAVDLNGLVHLAGSTGLISTFTPGQGQAPRIFGIANAAGGVLSGRVTTGEIIAIYGEHFGAAANVGNTRLSFANGSGTALQSPSVLYVSDTQINAIAPPFDPSNATSGLQITINGVALAAMRLAVDPAAPEIFQVASGSAGMNQAGVNQDGSLNSSDHPAKPGSFVSVWASGAGGSGPQIASGAYEYPFCSCAVVAGSYNNVLNGSLYAPYFGAAPGLMASVTQVNFQIPTGVQGPITVRLNVNGVYSDPVEIWVAP